LIAITKITYQNAIPVRYKQDFINVSPSEVDFVLLYHLYKLFQLQLL
jgi:hypothetical protein